MTSCGCGSSPNLARARLGRDIRARQFREYFVAVQPVAIAAAVLGRPVRSATVVAQTPIAYDPFLAGRHVDRVLGVAETPDGDRLEWRAVVKRTVGPGLRAARRELAAYRIGLADPAPGVPFRGPALLAWEEDAGRVELWLEWLTDEHDGTWAPDRFGVAALHVGAWDVRAGTLALPSDFDSEDAWAERHGQPERLGEALAELESLRYAPKSPELTAQLEDGDFGRTRALIASTPRRIERLAGLPQTLLHHDLVRSNLFSLSRGETAAIDWENVGRGPYGVDLAPLVVGSVRRGEASADDIASIEEAVLAGYVLALRQAGVANEPEVREAYRLAVGLRWHVVLGTIRAWLDPTMRGMRGSRRGEPRADGLRNLVALSRHILDAASAEETSRRRDAGPSSPR